MGFGIVFAISEQGHRRSYVDALCSLCGYRPLTKSPRLGVFWLLMRADGVVFSTYEESALFATAVSALRSFHGRSTTIIVMNPARVLTGGGVEHRLKGIVLRLLRSLPRVTTLSIIPAYIDDRLAALTSDWIYDPQFWDLGVADGDEPHNLRTVLPLGVRAKGKRVLLYLGSASSHKGFEFLVAFLESGSLHNSDWVCIAAGRSSSSIRPLVQRFEEAGGVLIDRYLSEAEVLGLKKSASCLWAVYAPTYDSSSGIFGRALQLGKPVLVRQGSIIHRIGEIEGGRVLPVPWGDELGVARLLDNLPPDDTEIEVRTLRMRDRSVQRIQQSIEDRD